MLHVEKTLFNSYNYNFLISVELYKLIYYWVKFSLLFLFVVCSLGIVFCSLTKPSKFVYHSCLVHYLVGENDSSQSSKFTVMNQFTTKSLKQNNLLNCMIFLHGRTFFSDWELISYLVLNRLTYNWVTLEIYFFL